MYATALLGQANRGMLLGSVWRGHKDMVERGHTTSEVDPTDLRSASAHSSFCRHLCVPNGAALHQVPDLCELSDFAVGGWLW